MVMSTRCRSTSGTTCTPPEGFVCALNGSTKAAARQPRNSLGIHFACNHYLLGRVVEGRLLAGLNSGDVHAQRNRVAVTGFNAGVRGLPRPDALHPIEHVCGCLRIPASIGGGLNRLRALAQ